MEVMLRKADRSDIPLIVSMQRKAFFPLYEIYRGDGSPALESEEKVAARFEAAGSRALKMVENLYPETEHWELDTIKEEAGNCHFYEKAGYQSVGEVHL